MTIARRLLDAARSPARFLAFARRIWQLYRAGDLRPAWRRLRARSPTSAQYRALLQRQATLLPTRGDSFAFVALLDIRPSIDRDRLAAEFAATPGCRHVLARAEAHSWTDGNASHARALADWLPAGEEAACWLWWIAEPVLLEPNAHAALAAATRMPGARIVYGDHGECDDAGRPAEPCLAPAFDRESLLEQPYTGPVLLVHESLAGRLGEVAHGGLAGPWSLLLALEPELPADAFVHVPYVLAHIARDVNAAATAQARRSVRDDVVDAAARRGATVRADPDAVPWLAFGAPNDPLAASIVIPTRDRPALLRRCLESLLRTHGAAFEVIVVDNGSTDPAAVRLLDDWRARTSLAVVRDDGPFNFARLCNVGVTQARGRVVVLLNNDTEAADPGWLRELVSIAARPDVGAAGPLLTYPNGTIQSAGVLLGVNRTSTNALAGFPLDDPAARRWCSSRRRVSAVVGACMAVERSKYLVVGGLDERFAVSHNELDVCLRLEQRGWDNVFTPFAHVVHVEGATRGYEVTAEERARLAREERAFGERWGPRIARTDPAHHPLLARAGNPFAFAADPVLEPRRGWSAWAPE